MSTLPLKSLLARKNMMGYYQWLSNMQDTNENILNIVNVLYFDRFRIIKEFLTIPITDTKNFEEFQTEIERAKMIQKYNKFVRSFPKHIKKMVLIDFKELDWIKTPYYLFEKNNPKVSQTEYEEIMRKSHWSFDVYLISSMMSFNFLDEVSRFKRNIAKYETREEFSENLSLFLDVIRKKDFDEMYDFIPKNSKHVSILYSDENKKVILCEAYNSKGVKLLGSGIWCTQGRFHFKSYVGMGRKFILIYPKNSGGFDKIAFVVNAYGKISSAFDSSNYPVSVKTISTLIKNSVTDELCRSIFSFRFRRYFVRLLSIIFE